MAVRRRLAVLVVMFSLISGFTVGSPSIAGAASRPSVPAAPTSL
jgi:hypothetical protein